MTIGERELDEARSEWERFYAQVERRQLSRRRVLRAGTALGLLGMGGMSALFAGCSSDEEEPPAGGGASPAAAGGTTAPAAEPEGITGDWDTTGTPPYRNGLPDSVANPDPAWQQYPWTYKYGPWRYDWNIPVSRGGHVIVPWAAPSNYDMMISGIASQPTNDKLFNAGLREGLNLLTASIEPDLAIAQEHTPDYATWTFTIPGNAKFHNKPPVNGRLLTADDVVFSFERHIDTGVNRSALRNVARITAPDATTVRFELSAPSLNFPTTLASPHLPVFAPEVFEDQEFFKANPIGTGPFVLEFSEFQNRADWVRNPEYWQTMPIKPEKYGTAPLPLVDKYTRQYFANNVTAKEAFFNGQVDQFSPGCGVDTALIREQLERVPEALVITNAYWSCCPLGLLFQYDNPLFQDRRVRQALSMGINREQVWSGGMDSTGAIGASPIPFDFQGVELPTPLADFGENAQYNPQRAKELLVEAGLTPPLKLEIYASTGQPAAWQGALDTVVFNWKQAGVADATIVVRDAQVLSQDQINKSFPELLFTSAGSLAFGYSLDASVAPPLLTDSPRNFGNLSDPVLDDLIQRWSVSVDPDEGARLATEMSQRIVDEVDHLWFAWIGGAEIDRSWLHGSVMSTHNCYNGIGWGNLKYMWIDDTAPGGRGGTLV